MLGLAQVDDEDDDSHLCIKCNATIIGLDNYVKHRKAMCNKTKISLPTSLNLNVINPIKSDSVQTVSRETVTYRENPQGADVFFQSLELQSSAKRPPVSGTTSLPTGGKTGAGVLTRRATAAMFSTGKDIHGFSNSSTNVVSQKRGEDWIGGHNLQVTGTDDNQTKLIKAVANICETVKKPITPSFTLIDDYKQDDESNEDSEESDEIDDDDHIQTSGKWKPPATHTGGKWKPTYNSRDNSSHWPSTSAVTPEPDNADDWEDEHMGGKWKPFLSQSVETLTRLDKIHELDEEEDDAYMPPPGHTKGKWIPGAKDGIKLDHKAQIMDATTMCKEGGSVQYWCGPCNRRLGSRIIYEKHLLSNLHLKRTLPEKDLEYSGAMKNRSIITIGKRAIKPSIYLNDSIFLHTKRQNKKEKKDEINLQSIKKRRRRRPTLLTCAICKYRVKPFLMGKHLISHYHFRKAASNDELNNSQILENIHRIVLQSPFQCSPCKFFSNWQAVFLQHWNSPEHKEVTGNISGRFWCSFCKFESVDSSLFEEHLIGPDHQEVVAAINRSMPIIIRKKSVIQCNFCNKEFKYNVQLKRHGKLYCRGNNSSTASDEYQGKKKCNQCSFTCKSRIGLSRHVKLRHGRKVYFCSACSVEFTNVVEARAHRSSQPHRIKEKEKRVEKGLEAKDISKACPHCDAPRFKNIIELKHHLQEKHQDASCSCPQCGMKFTLPQEVTWHIRHRACAFTASGLTSYSNTHMWNCRVCPYVTTSHAECIFHEVLHGNPVEELDDDKKHDKSNVKYACPVCHKLFLKHSLRCHLRQHTNERPHACGVCGATFSRKSNLVFHTKRSHTAAAPEPTPREPPTEDKTDEASKPFLCSVCGVGFTKKYNLKQHATRHLGRAWSCTVRDCPYSARSPSELRAHQAAHSSARPHHCAECHYAAKTKNQLARHSKMHSETREKNVQCPHCPYRTEQRARLERHLRLHTGAKPYACRYCPFTCNNLENLRKHVLSRNKHKDKFLYECEHCTSPEAYSTNFAKEFRVHLSTAHPSLYPDHKCTAMYVANYLKVEEVKSDLMNSDYNIDGIKFGMSSENAKFEGVYTEGDNVEKIYTEQTDHSVILEFPTEGCYSVTESGALVPYEND